MECGSPTSPASTGEPIASGADVTVSFADAVVAGCSNSGVITRTWTVTGALELTALLKIAPVKYRLLIQGGKSRSAGASSSARFRHVHVIETLISGF